MKPVLITTKNRGIYYGYLLHDQGPVACTLTRARVVATWDCGHEGFLALAVRGPRGRAEVSPQCEELTIYDIDTVALVTDAAAEEWDNA